MEVTLDGSNISRWLAGTLVAGFVFGASATLPAQALEERGLVVLDLSFNGNRAIDDRTLQLSIATSQSSLVARFGLTRWLGIGTKRYLNETEFRRDVLRLILLYRQSGYPRVHVDTLVRRSPEHVRIRFDIQEGPPVVVRSLAISGTEGIVPERALTAALPLAVGDPFNRFRFEAAADSIRTAFRDRGYPFVEVFRRYDVNEDSLVADVAFEVAPGSLALVDSVMVEGTQKIHQDVIRRIIALHAGSPFRQSDVYESQRDLYRLGVFSYANVTLADSLPDGQGDSLVSVRVQVAEGPLRRFRAGAGYGTLDCVRVLATWTAYNAFGGGRSLGLTARASKIGVADPSGAGFEHHLCRQLQPDVGTARLDFIDYNLSASLREPFLFSRRTRGVLSLSAERHSEINAFVREAVGSSVGATWETGWGIPVTLSYELSYGRTQAEPAIFCSYLLVCQVSDTLLFAKRRVQSTIAARGVRDRTNSVLDPTRGNTLSAELRHASRTIGSDELIQFTRGTAEVTSYHPLSRRTTFAWRVRIGSIVAPQQGLPGQSARIVPPAERFYGGGPNSVRGYSQNLLGPLVRVVDTIVIDTILRPRPGGGGSDTIFGADTLTAPRGGNQLVFANAELRFPLPVFGDRFGAALFVDAGQVVERSDSQTVSLDGFRVTPGLGLRFVTPLGPVRLDVAYNPYGPGVGPLYRRAGQQLIEVARSYPDDPVAPERFIDRLRIHLAVGQPF